MLKKGHLFGLLNASIATARLSSTGMSQLSRVDHCRGGIVVSLFRVVVLVLLLLVQQAGMSFVTGGSDQSTAFVLQFIVVQGLRHLGLIGPIQTERTSRGTIGMIAHDQTVGSDVHLIKRHVLLLGLWLLLFGRRGGLDGNGGGFVRREGKGGRRRGRRRLQVLGGSVWLGEHTLFLVCGGTQTNGPLAQQSTRGNGHGRRFVLLYCGTRTRKTHGLVCLLWLCLTRCLFCEMQKGEGSNERDKKKEAERVFCVV